MDKTKLLVSIKELIDVLNNYRETSKFEITAEQRLVIREVYAELMPGTNPEINCDSCVRNAIGILIPYYEREHPKHTNDKGL